MNTLPPMRELPPRRHAEIRAQLQRTVLSDTAGHPRAGVPGVPGVPRVLRAIGAQAGRAGHGTTVAGRWLVPAAAAAAAVVALGAVTVLAAHDGGSVGTRVTPASAGAGAGVPLGSASVVSSTPSGPGPAGNEAREIERGCLASAGLGHTGGTQAAPTTGPSGAGVRLVNLVSDDAGRLALLYGPDAVLTCLIAGPGMPYNASFGPLSGGAGQPPETIMVDSEGANSGGDTPGNKDANRGQHGFELAAGRITHDVARVTMTIDGDTVDAVLANGTFIARLVHPSTWTIPNGRRPVLIRAYDDAGNELASIDPTAPGTR
jgi:hypothetical protein